MCEKTLNLATELCTVPHKQENPVFGYQEISAITSPLTSGHLTLLIAIFLITVYSMIEWEANIVVAFTNLNQETVGKAY